LWSLPTFLLTALACGLLLAGALLLTLWDERRESV
jgi:hypothetical protein